EALQYALKTERDGYQYFKDASDKAQHAVTKKFFAQLAEDEVEHIRLINEFHDALKDSAGTAELRIPKDPENYKKRLKTIFDEARKDFDENVKQDTGILEVYRHSMDLETQAANFYKERRDVTKFEQVKKFYDWLFHFESGHYAMLSETLSYLENPEQWYLDFERSIFEG
ncbi:ferritin family protein, partial [bacterium]|nr:ferritin family protein [bacterium]